MKRLYDPDYRTEFGRFVRIAGFHPLNWYVWNRHTGQRPWTPEESGDMPRWRYRLVMLRKHRKFAR